jgi:hypothetical protein
MKQIFSNTARLQLGYTRRATLLLGLSGLVSGAFGQSFAPAITYPSGGHRPFDVALGDVNGDGRLDLVTANSGSFPPMLGVLLGQAGGTFAAATTYSSGGDGPGHVALGDVNGDGRLDIVAANITSANVGVLLGQAGGTFAAAITYSSGGTSPYGVELGDVNGDGRLDIVTNNYASGTLGVLLGQAGGAFAAATTYSSGGSHPRGVALGDVNGDGRLDIVVANSDSYQVGVLLGQAGGTFGTATAYHPGNSSPGNSSPFAVALSDVNGDGRLDIVATNTNSADVGVLLGQTGGTFGVAIAYPAGGLTPKGERDGPSGLELGDVNGDGRLDIVTANPNSNRVMLLLGQAGGTFAAATTYPSGGERTAYVALGDVNGDGWPDIVTTSVDSDNVGVLLNLSSTLATSPAAGAADLALYPNPAHAGFTVEVPAVAGATEFQAVLLNSLGQAVRRRRAPLPATGSHLSLETSGLAAGVYTLQLRAGASTIVKRVVVQ